MKELLLQLAAYNVWANQQVGNSMLTLPEEKLVAELPSSFKSIFKTVLHMWDAESIWWQRIKLEERIIVPSEVYSSNFQELVKNQIDQSKQFEEWVGKASELALNHVFAYQNSKKEQFKQPVYQVLIHIFNHGTYHRGQLVNLLRQSAVKDIPATDFILWSRKK